MSEVFRGTTDNHFKADVLEHRGLVLVDFVEEDSPSCNSLEAALKQVMPPYNAKAKFVKMDVHETPGTTAKYGIGTVPTVLVFRDGEEVAREVGPLSVEKLTSLLDSAGQGLR